MIFEIVSPKGMADFTAMAYGYWLVPLSGFFVGITGYSFTLLVGCQCRMDPCDTE